MAPKDRKRVDPNSNYGVDRAAKIAGRAAKSGGLYTRFVEIGRVVLIQFGESEGKGREGREGGAAGGLAARRTRAPRVRTRWRAASAPDGAARLTRSRAARAAHTATATRCRGRRKRASARPRARAANRERAADERVPASGAPLRARTLSALGPRLGCRARDARCAGRGPRFLLSLCLRPDPPPLCLRRPGPRSPSLCPQAPTPASLARSWTSSTTRARSSTRR